MVLVILAVFMSLLVETVWATDFYIHIGASGCSTPVDTDYDASTGTCGSGTSTVYNHTTISSMTAVVAGDTIYIRQGTYTTAIALGSKIGGTGTNQFIKLIKYPGETVTFQKPAPAGGATADYNITATCTAHNFWFEGLIFDGINGVNDISRVIHRNCGFTPATETTIPAYFVFIGNEFKNHYAHFALVKGVYWRFINNYFHDQRADCWLNDSGLPSHSAHMHYNLYVNAATDVEIAGNEMTGGPGGAAQVYPGPNTNISIHNNNIHDNTWCSNQAYAFVIGQNSHGTKFYDNTLWHNGRYSTSRVAGVMGLQLQGGVDNVQVVNNAIYDNKTYGIEINNAGSTGIAIKNNAILENGVGAISNLGSVTQTTNKTTGLAADCFVDAANGDFRLIQGTNPCRGGGTSDVLRPSPIGTTDIGPYEQGTVASAVVASGFIDLTVNVMTPGVLPVSAITGATVACVGCTGTPVVSAAQVKAGANNIVQLTISGISSSGSCTVSVGSTNMGDSGYIGTTTRGIAQTVNSVSALSVSGTCDNSAGGAAPSTPSVHHTMNEGAGTTLADAEPVTGGNQPSTLSGSPTWVAEAVEGAGITFTSGVDQRATFSYGNAVDPRAQSFTFCVWVKMGTGITNKVIMGTLSGSSNKLYIGMHSSLNTWGIGVGSSTISTGAASEFPVTETWTRVCAVNDAGTDTVTLSVNGVKGTSASAVKSSASITALASHFLIGCGVLSGTTNCGGYTVDEPKIWTSALSTAELLADFESYTPPGASLACYAETAHQWEGVYYSSAGATRVLSTATTIEVVPNGGVALVFQVDCTGSAGSSVALRLYYSTDGSSFDLFVPETFGAANVSMWRDSFETGLNSSTATCCLSGALTANHGPTVLSSTVTPTIALSQNHSYTVRFILRVGDIAGSSRWFQLKQDNGADLVGGSATTPKITVVNPRASNGF